MMQVTCTFQWVCPACKTARELDHRPGRLGRRIVQRHTIFVQVSVEELSKEQQTSDWGTDGDLTPQQLTYAASDVLYLHALKDRLDALLAREGRTEIAQACFRFLPTRAALDLLDWEDIDIFAH